jgi:hypothetical protein
MAPTANKPKKLDAHDGEPWTEMDIEDLNRQRWVAACQGQSKKSGARLKSLD